MANPFYVAPPDTSGFLKSLMSGYDRSREMGKSAARDEAAQAYMAGDKQGALARLLRIGDMQGAQTLANLGNNERDFAFRRQEAQRAQQNADRSYGLQEKQLGVTAANTAATRDLARRQFEFQQEQGNRPEIRDVNGVPMLVDRKNNRMVPIGGTPSAPADIPPGVDPTTYRREQAQAAVKSEAENRSLAEGGRGVLAMVDQLERKISDPRFGAATGPFVAPASEASTLDPRRWAYEAVQSRGDKAYLAQIKQDAQAINSTMQRALLKGGGAISDSERASINQILGEIAQARSPEEARALLTNFKGIVRQMFKMPTEATAPQQSGNLPPLPPGFVVQ